MQNRHKTLAVIAPTRPSIDFTLMAILMLATPLILFAIGCARNSVFLVDGSGALFGMDITLLLWLHDEWNRAPNRGVPVPIPVRNRDSR